MFPEFGAPSFLDESQELGMRLIGSVTAAFGSDVETFLRTHAAQSMTGEHRFKPVPFAQVLAKIAYCYAWFDGTLGFVRNADRLVDAFMWHPDQLGQFVGTQAEAIPRFDGLGFRVDYAWHPAGVLVSEVQLFPDIPLPVYQVVLGDTSLCDWKRLRRHLDSRSPRTVIS